jgi:hypothetical protein
MHEDMPEPLITSASSPRRFPFRALIFVALVLVGAVGLFRLSRDLTTCWRLTALPGMPSASCANSSVSALEGPILVKAGETAVPTSVPEAPIPEEEYSAWDGASRINILFVGFRGGDPQKGDCPFCTDTLILLTVDPLTKTAGMLSIPRDMWVNIPGFGYSRINTAWTLGITCRSILIPSSMSSICSAAWTCITTKICGLIRCHMAKIIPK